MSGNRTNAYNNNVNNNTNNQSNEPNIQIKNDINSNKDLQTSMEYAIHLYLTQAPTVFSEFEQNKIYSRFMRFLSTLKQKTWQKWISGVMNEKPLITMEDLIDVNSENIRTTRNNSNKKIAKCLPLEPYRLSSDVLGVKLFDERPKHVKILLGKVFHSFIHYKHIKFSEFEEIDIVQLFLGCLFYCYDTYLRKTQNPAILKNLSHSEYLWLVYTYITQVVHIMKKISKEMQLICNQSLLLHLPQLKIELSIYELQQCLRGLPICTHHAVWQKLIKNKDGVIGDERNLSLCIHILICLALRAKDKQIRKPDMKTNEIYLVFLNKIKEYLVKNFANRMLRVKQNPNHYMLRKCESQSELCVGFQDIVEHLPLWLYRIDQSIYHNGGNIIQ